MDYKKEKLVQLNRDELMVIAKRLKLKRYSKLKKEELCDYILERCKGDEKPLKMILEIQPKKTYKKWWKKIYGIIGILGGVASIIALIIVLFPYQKGNNPPNANITQKGSSIILGSQNIVKITPNDNIEHDSSILITKKYRHLVEFSLISTGGFYEVLKLYVELLRIYQCVPGPKLIEEISFRINYSMILVPNIRIYPLLPPTFTNSQDSWVLKGKDIDLFSIDFSWPHMTSVDIMIKAELYDHINKEKKYICSEPIRLERNGESRTEKFNQPEDGTINLSPYLYKLLTVKDLLEKANDAHVTLNKGAYEEIASLFRSDPSQFQRCIKIDNDNELMFEASVHPDIARRLIKLAREISSKLSKEIFSGLPPFS